MCVPGALGSSSSSFLSNFVTRTVSVASYLRMIHSISLQLSRGHKIILNSTYSTLNLGFIHLHILGTASPHIPTTLSGITSKERLPPLSPARPPPSAQLSLVLLVLPPKFLLNFYISSYPHWHYCISSHQYFSPGLKKSFFTDFPSSPQVSLQFILHKSGT